MTWVIYADDEETGTRYYRTDAQEDLERIDTYAHEDAQWPDVLKFDNTWVEDEDGNFEQVPGEVLARNAAGSLSAFGFRDWHVLEWGQWP